MTAEGKKETRQGRIRSVIRQRTFATARRYTNCDIGVRNGTIVARGQGLAAGTRDIDLQPAGW